MSFALCAKPLASKLFLAHTILSNCTFARHYQFIRSLTFWLGFNFYHQLFSFQGSFLFSFCCSRWQLRYCIISFRACQELFSFFKTFFFLAFAFRISKKYITTFRIFCQHFFSFSFWFFLNLFLKSILYIQQIRFIIILN